MPRAEITKDFEYPIILDLGRSARKDLPKILPPNVVHFDNALARIDAPDGRNKGEFVKPQQSRRFQIEV
jgi:hypothetical protein